MARGAGCCSLAMCCVLAQVKAAVLIFTFFILHQAGIELASIDPDFSIQDFYIPALNITTEDTRNTTMFFNLAVINANDYAGIIYYAQHISVYFHDGPEILIANFSLPAFYQPTSDENYLIKERFEAVGMPWDRARREVTNGSTIMFRVNLSTTVRYYFYELWKTKSYRITAAGNNLRVDSTGHLQEEVSLAGADFSFIRWFFGGLALAVSATTLSFALLFLLLTMVNMLCHCRLNTCEESCCVESPF